MNSGQQAAGSGQRANRQRKPPGEPPARRPTLPVRPCLVAACCLLPALLLAADPAALERSAERVGVVGRVRVEPAVVPLTGAVTVSVRVEGAAPLAVEPVRFPDAPGWQVKPAGDAVTAPLADGRQRWEQAFRAVPDRPGELALPLPAVRARAGGRDSAVELTFEAVTVGVTTRLPRAELDDARDVTGPEPPPPAPPSTAAAWLAALGTAAGALVAVWRWRVRRGRAVGPEPAPAEWLAGQLTRLATLDPGSHAAADALGATARGYVARRYQVAADGRTTAELLTLLPADAPATWRDLLERCDLAKFARAGFTPAEWDKALDQLRGQTDRTG